MVTCCASHSFQQSLKYCSSDWSVWEWKWCRGGPLSFLCLSSVASRNSTAVKMCLYQMPSRRKSEILSRWAWYACGYLRMTLCGMTVFSGGVKRRANFRSWDSCSFTESLCWFSSDFISACILMMPGVIISPGLLLGVATEMLDKILKWRSCCSMLVELEQIIRRWMGACTTKKCRHLPYKFFSVRIWGFPITSLHVMAWRKVWMWSLRMLLGQHFSGLA